MSTNQGPTEEEIEFILRLDLMSFVGKCFQELNPGQEFSDTPYLGILTAKVAECLLGRGSKRLIINLPPRSLKSITVSVAAVAWLLGLNPSKEVICASYGQVLADKHGRDTRTIMMSPFYKKLFPQTKLAAQKRSVNDFSTTMHGFRMATSVGGVLTGRGGDVLILDDILKPDDALSDLKRNAANDWFQNTLLSRLNNKREGIIIIIMQRLHQDDLVGHVQKGDERWDVLSFPAIAEQDELHRAEGAFAPVFYKRKMGEVLDPTRDTLESLKALQKEITDYNFSAQYQQNPTPLEGTIIKAASMQYYDPDAPLPKFSYKLQSWDTANKKEELNDFSVCTTWGFWKDKFFLLDVFKKRLDYPELRRSVIEQAAKHKPNCILIEDRASGTQLIQDLKFAGVHNIKAYSPLSHMDKTMRLHAQSIHFEAGNVLLPLRAPWLDDYVREITGFPGLRFDDQVDSTTQALDYICRIATTPQWAKLGADYKGDIPLWARPLL